MKIKRERANSDFVGIYFEGGALSAVYPKYVADPARDEDFAHLKLALKAALKYARTEARSGAAQGSSAHSELAAALLLCADFAECGDYLCTRAAVALNGSAEIDWQQTFERIEPLWQGARPVWAQYFTRAANAAHAPITAVFRAAASDAARRFGAVIKLLSMRALGCVQAPDLRSFGGAALKICEREQEREFSPPRLVRLALLANYLRARLADDGGCTGFYQQNFWPVWEAAVRAHFGHDESLQGYFKPPVWQHEGGQICGKSRLRPDVLARSGDGEVEIYDAKYYVPDFRAGAADQPTAKGAPGAADVSKQLSYAQQLAAQGLRVRRNAFVFPGDPFAPARTGGRVSFASAQDQSVEFLFLNAAEAFKSYLSANF